MAFSDSDMGPGMMWSLALLSSSAERPAMTFADCIVWFIIGAAAARALLDAG